MPATTTAASPTSGCVRADARLIVANCEDTVNTNITLTVREVAPTVHIAAIVEEEDSVDILRVSVAPRRSCR